ncbi:sensor histidine kinase [Sphingosinicella soli]|uniref:histidine kinase n=1 Tax=Sphingosinicella soli TaxID=333708 RepID=A0A7W7F6T0_9SPHN|nr:HAMP domain-containing sensor histidine kinase [Sphingosinicella soli]MBB4631897.1 signal transduction histidine kinase [Sphingosinicella soli]
MQDWLTDAMEPPGDDLPGRAVDTSIRPAALLSGPDIALCLTGGVAVVMGSEPVGRISGARLAQALARAVEIADREARTARDEVRRLRRDRRMLAANLSHELKTPINAISGYSELVALGLECGRTHAAASQNAVIWEAAQGMLSTLDSVLDLARIEADAAPLDETDVDIRQLATSVLRMLATMAEARGAGVAVEMPADLPLLHADARMLRQILVNLANNALKYGGENVRLTIAARVDRAERMLIEVRDSGPGMSPRAIETAMKPFARGQDDTGMLAGSGLGLPLVKALTELHEGSFKLLSSPGRGTRAVVTMPPGRVRLDRRGRQEAFAFRRANSLFG